jgi:hypothetical protein
VSTHDGVRSFRPELTASIDIWAFLNEELHNLNVTILRGQVEAGVSILVWNLGEHIQWGQKFHGRMYH